MTDKEVQLPRFPRLGIAKPNIWDWQNNLCFKSFLCIYIAEINFHSSDTEFRKIVFELPDEETDKQFIETPSFSFQTFCHEESV